MPTFITFDVDELDLEIRRRLVQHPEALAIMLDFLQVKRLDNRHWNVASLKGADEPHCPILPEEVFTDLVITFQPEQQPELLRRFAKAYFPHAILNEDEAILTQVQHLVKHIVKVKSRRYVIALCALFRTGETLV